MDGRYVLSSSEESHKLVDEVLVGETTALDRDGEDVDIGPFALCELGAFGLHEVVRNTSDGRNGFLHLRITFERQYAKKPLREKHCQDLYDARASSRIEDRLVNYVQLVARIGKCVEVLAHAGDADDIQCRAGRPVFDFYHVGAARVVLDGLGDGVCHLDGFIPKHRVQVLDVPERKSRHQRFSLTLRHCQTVTFSFGLVDLPCVRCPRLTGSQSQAAYPNLPSHYGV